MVKVITISTAGDIIKGVKTLNRIKKRFPQMTRLGMRRWGKILERDTKISATKAGIKDFSGTLMDKGIRWEQSVRGNTGFLFIRLHGIYLDSMKPHWVNVIKRRSRLLRWAKIAKNNNIRTKARRVEKGELKKFSIFVKPHPFIANGFRRARPKLRPVLRRLTKRIRRSF